MIPLLDLKRQFVALQQPLEKAALDVLSSGQYVLGPAVDAFESACAQALGTRHAVGVANGTDALLLSLRALGIECGDEVITTPFTFIATAEVLSMIGAKPVFVDIERDTFNLDPQAVEAAITERTRAIIPVHIFGHPAPMNELRVLAQKHNLFLLEDAAQAWGASMDLDGASTRCGALGDIASFSFFPTKNLGACGEGGLVSTDDDNFAERVRMLRVHGQRRRYIHDEIGYNSRLHAMQAALLHVKLAHADNWNDARRAHATHYNALVENLPLQTPTERDGCRHVYHQYTLRFDEKTDSRQTVCVALTQAEISWAIYYPVPLHLQPVYESLGYKEGEFPEAEKAAREVLSLPIFPELREDEVEKVATTIRAALAK
jgi:dTDP-4-amino-4,6-dideoxygalactose transaminase